MVFTHTLTHSLSHTGLLPLKDLFENREREAKYFKTTLRTAAELLLCVPQDKLGDEIEKKNKKKTTGRLHRSNFFYIIQSLVDIKK